MRDDHFSGHELQAECKRVVDNGFQLREIHTVAKIHNNEVTLREPIHVDIRNTYNVRVSRINMLKNIGVEDILFRGNWSSYGEDFIHHKECDRVHDWGWSSVRFNLVHNGWIRNVKFKDFNQNVFILTSSAVTIMPPKIYRRTRYETTFY